MKKKTFYQALVEGNITEVKGFIEKGINLKRTVGSSNLNPLEIAVSHGHYEIVEILLNSGIFTDFVNQCGLLEVATSRGDVEIIKLLISSGIDVNQKFLEDDETALMYVAGIGEIQAVRDLVDTGVDVNAITCQGKSALFYAAWAGYQEVYDYLHPLTAPELRREAEEVLGMGVTRRQRLEDELLQKFVEAASIGDLEALVLSLQKGVDVNAFNEDGESALVIASNNVNYSIVKVLIEVGADVNLGTEIDSITPLMAASGFLSVRNPQVSGVQVLQLQLQVIDSLIQAGANINTTTNDGWTALMLSVASNNLQITERLIREGADINARETTGDTALSLAQRHNNNEMIELLLDAGATEE